MAQQTLFTILLRQPWWVTLLVAFALFAVVHAVFPPRAPFVALPFAGLSVYIAYRQLRGSAGVDAGERLALIRPVDWQELSALIGEAYKRQGFAVPASSTAGYDFTLTKDGRATLLQCRRWKVNQ